MLLGARPQVQCNEILDLAGMQKRFLMQQRAANKFYLTSQCSPLCTSVRAKNAF